MATTTMRKTADNDAMTAARAKAYAEAAGTEAGRAALGKTSPQEWALRGAGAVGGGFLAWLLGRTLFRKSRLLQLLTGALGMAGGAYGADWLMKHLSGVTGSDLSYSDIVRLRRGVAGLVEKANDLEDKGAGKPNTPFQRALNRHEAEPGSFSYRNTLGVGGAALGVAGGAYTGRVPFMHLSANDLEKASRRATVGLTNSKAGQTLRQVIDGTHINKLPTLDQKRLRRMQENGMLDVKYDQNGLPTLTRATPTLRQRAAGAAGYAALLGAAGYVSGLVADKIAGPRYSPGALASATKAKIYGD